MLLRIIVDKTTKIVAYTKRNQCIDPGSGTVKVNVGCGLSVAPGWINIDGSLNALAARWPPVFLALLYRISGSRRYFPRDEYVSILKNHWFIHHEIRYGLPFPGESVHYVYASHFLEHLYKSDGRRFLEESYRVLKLGGVVRILVPDLAEAISLYESGHKDEALSNFFSDSSEMYSQHHYLYDFDMLQDLLMSVGFSKVEQLSHCQGVVPDIETLDSRPASLIVEATK